MAAATAIATSPAPTRPRRRIARWAVAGVLAGLMIAACETGGVNGQTGGETGAQNGGQTGTPPAQPAPAQGAFNFTSSGDAAFDAWRNGFAAKAEAQGRRRAAIIAVLDNITPMQQRVQAAATDQAEFVKPIWDYARTAISATRIANGQRLMQENARIFDQLDASYATPREILTAIWGMESSYGSFMGDIDAPSSIATQAAMGRRQPFNEGELLAIMQLLEDGSATREQFRKASWAGAVGQTQFMPSTFLAHARDFDRDGKKDLWGNVGDALASAANYLTVSGWRKGEPWAQEVRIPEGFDYSLGDGRKMSMGQWKATGLTQAMAGGMTASDGLQAELFLPAGSYGPAFLLFDNFQVIKRYNNADSYALAVGLLADRIAGRPDLSRPWPNQMVMLTQQQAKDLQSALDKLGYNPGAADGIIGRNTRRSLQSFQKDRGLVADGFPTVDMLNAVLAAAA